MKYLILSILNRDLQSQCSKAYNEIMNMIKNNVTTLQYGDDNGYETYLIDRTDFTEPYEVQMYNNNLDVSIFTDIIPKITLNTLTVPEDKSFAIPSLFYKIGNKICSLDRNYDYQLNCERYSSPYPLYYQKGNLYDKTIYTFPELDLLYLHEGNFFPSRTHVGHEDKEYQYSDEIDVKEKLDIENERRMNEMYAEIIEGINAESSPVSPTSAPPIPSYDPTSTPSFEPPPDPPNSFNETFNNKAYYFKRDYYDVAHYLLNDSYLVVQKIWDDRLFKIEYQYDYVYDYHLYIQNLTLNEDKSWFYYADKRINEFNKDGKCDLKKNEYTYKEIKDLCSSIKTAVEGIIKNLELPYEYSYPYLHFNSTQIYGSDCIYLVYLFFYR